MPYTLYFSEFLLEKSKNDKREPSNLQDIEKHALPKTFPAKTTPSF